MNCFRVSLGLCVVFGCGRTDNAILVPGGETDSTTIGNDEATDDSAETDPDSWGDTYWDTGWYETSDSWSDTWAESSWSDECGFVGCTTWGESEWSESTWGDSTSSNETSTTTSTTSESSSTTGSESTSDSSTGNPTPDCSDAANCIIACGNFEQMCLQSCLDGIPGDQLNLFVDLELCALQSCFFLGECEFGQFNAPACVTCRIEATKSPPDYGCEAEGDACYS